MREGFEVISGGKTGRILLFGAVIAMVAAVAITFSAKTGPDASTASADSLAAPASAPAAAGYIKFDGIEGEATDRDHSGWSDIHSFSQSVAVPVTVDAQGSGRVRGVPRARDLVLVKELDKASPKLMLASFNGTVMETVVFDVAAASADGGNRTYLKYELKNVIITNYRVSGSASGNSVPTETISLNFEEIKMTYTENRADGTTGESTEAGWNVTQNRATK